MTAGGAGTYRPKSSSFESFLDQLNEAVVAGFDGDDFPRADLVSAQITGLPRSGTTILNQLLARTGAVGYVSNVMAMFWKAPVVGARIQQFLTGADPTVSASSTAGRTREPLDPHEFGYFWRAAFGHSRNSVERDLEAWPAARLQDELDAVAAVFGAPVVYKNFLVLPHVDELRRDLPRGRYVLLDRPIEDVAASLLRLREDLGTAAPPALGLQPAARPAGGPTGVLHDVAHQVVALRRLQDRGRFDASPDSFVVRYADLCARPRAVVAEVLDFVGADPSRTRIDSIPETLQGRSAVAALDAAQRTALDDALRRADAAMTENEDD